MAIMEFGVWRNIGAFIMKIEKGHGLSGQK